MSPAQRCSRRLGHELARRCTECRSGAASYPIARGLCIGRTAPDANAACRAPRRKASGRSPAAAACACAHRHTARLTRHSRVRPLAARALASLRLRAALGAIGAGLAMDRDQRGRGGCRDADLTVELRGGIGIGITVRFVPRSPYALLLRYGRRPQSRTAGTMMREGTMRSVSFAIVLTLLGSHPAWAQPFAPMPPSSRERGPLFSLHSGLCLGGGGRPAVEPCGQAGELVTLPVPGASGGFMLRHEPSGRCLFSNRDGRFGWYACTLAYSDQYWSWLPLPESDLAGGPRMLRSQHSGQCLFANADGRFGLYTCTVGYSDQHWRFGVPRPQPTLARPPESSSLFGTWYFADGSAIAVHEGGTFLLPDDGAGTWRPLRPREFELLFSSGRIDRVRLSPDGALLEGTSFWQGRSRPVSARRSPPAPPPRLPAPPPTPPLTPRVCPPPRACGIYCPYGMARDEHGCSQCACAPGPWGRPE